MNLAWLALSGMLCSLQLSTGSFPRPLSQEEERHCLERAAEGDLEARNILIEHNLRLVAHIMKKYYAAESDQEDLISIGTIGLIKAVSSYRLDKNIRLATYASRCIENATLSPATLSPERRRILTRGQDAQGRAETERGSSLSGLLPVFCKKITMVYNEDILSHKE